MFRFTVNGEPHEVAMDPHVPLVMVLRDALGLRDTKLGCTQGRCGACTVLLENQAVRSCQIPVEAVSGKQVTTIDGLGSTGRPHPLALVVQEAQASQCGHCGPGIVVDVKAFLDRTPHPTEAQVREVVKTHECMCGSSSQVIKAVLRFAATKGRP